MEDAGVHVAARRKAESARSALASSRRRRLTGKGSEDQRGRRVGRPRGAAQDSRTGSVGKKAGSHPSIIQSARRDRVRPQRRHGLRTEEATPAPEAAGLPVRFPLDGSAADPQRWRRLTFWVKVKPRLSWEQQEDQRSREAVPSSRPGPSLPLQSPAPSWDLIYSGFFKGKFGL